MMSLALQVMDNVWSARENATSSESGLAADLPEISLVDADREYLRVAEIVCT